jgi:imidazole glycerol-phosphate synthase subunit HisH
MIAIIDYGVGNLRSVQRGLERAGADVVITGDPVVIESAEGAVLPGVGAFGEGMAQLELRGLVLPIYQFIAAGKPFLGICLGMQLLFTTSEEMGRFDGLGVFKGTVRRFADAPGRKVPHVGWNQLRIRQPSVLLDDVANDSFAYFVHSYYVDPAQPELTVATTDYGPDFASVVARGNVFGVQFHPEKSQGVGAAILKNFVLLTV